MKLLLVTNIPPCRNIATGIVLDRMCRFFPEGTLACFSVADPRIKPDLSPCLEQIPYMHYDRPRESWRVFPLWMGTAFTWCMEEYTRTFNIPKIVAAAEDFAKSFRPDALWCILDGQTTIRMAIPLAKKLDIPLHSQVWDPPHGTLNAKELDSVTMAGVMKEFERALNYSTTCAAISAPMAQHYTEAYGTDAVTVYPCQEEKHAAKPGKLDKGKEEIIIGLGGQMYCPEAWDSFLETLSQNGWEINGRPIHLRVTGRKMNIAVDCPVQIEFLGWQKHADTVRLMGDCDLLYCPCWWTPEQDQQIRYSFPSKLPTFLASGRPVFFHGPENAAPAKFLREHNAGILCHSTDPAIIMKLLEDSLSDKEHYEQLCQNASSAFHSDLTLAAMRESMGKFLRIAPDSFIEASEIEKGNA